MKSYNQVNHINPKEYSIKFTGDYSELKNMGFSFQKLFARNYMQWNNGDIHIWKKGNEATHSFFNQFFPTVFNFFLNEGIENLKFEQKGNESYLFIFCNNKTFECTYDKDPYKKNNKRMYELFLMEEDLKENFNEDLQKELQEVLDSRWTSFVFKKSEINLLIELIKKNWLILEKNNLGN